MLLEGRLVNYRLIPDIFRSIISNKQLLIRYPDSVRPWQHVLEPLIGYMELAERLYSVKMCKAHGILGR